MRTVSACFNANEILESAAEKNIFNEIQAVINWILCKQECEMLCKKIKEKLTLSTAFPCTRRMGRIY